MPKRIERTDAPRDAEINETVEEIPGPPALVPEVQPISGTWSLATMGDDQFRQSLDSLKRGMQRIRQIKEEVMTSGVHYGVIPGTGRDAKPTLLKPGAEVMAQLFNHRADFIPEITYGDGVTKPQIEIRMRCEVHLGSLDGPIIAVGHGTASSWETKYRWRSAGRSCPKCGCVGTIIKGKEEYGGGWLCFAKKGGCGAKFSDGDQEIESQQVGQVENPDPHDQLNTLVKMAEKRSFIDGELRATASSDLFTQDLEDLPIQERDRGAEPPDGGPRRDATTQGQRDQKAPGRAAQAAKPGEAKGGPKPWDDPAMGETKIAKADASHLWSELFARERAAGVTRQASFAKMTEIIKPLGAASVVDLTYKDYQKVLDQIHEAFAKKEARRDFDRQVEREEDEARKVQDEGPDGDPWVEVPPHGDGDV